MGGDGEPYYASKNDGTLDIYVYRRRVIDDSVHNLSVTRAQAEEHLNEQKENFKTRFRPALLGLAMAAEGRPLDDPSAIREGTCRFLGWTRERHWLLG